MNAKLSIVVPNVNDKTGQSTAAVLARVNVEFAKRFGGFTNQEVTGGWLRDNGKLCHDDSTIVWSLVDDTPETRKAAVLLARFVRRFASQDCVLVWLEPVSFAALV